MDGNNIKRVMKKYIGVREEIIYLVSERPDEVVSIGTEMYEKLSEMSDADKILYLGALQLSERIIAEQRDRASRGGHVSAEVAHLIASSTRG